MWKEKRKEGYSPDITLPTDFQELLNGNFGDMCSFLYALHPRDLKQEMEHSNGLSNGYARNEGRLIADSCIGLNRLKYMEDENTVEGKKKRGI